MSNFAPAGWAEKLHTKLIATILSNINGFSKFFFRWPSSKFAVTWSLMIPPQLAYVAILLRARQTDGIWVPSVVFAGLIVVQTDEYIIIIIIIVVA